MGTRWGGWKNSLFSQNWSKTRKRCMASLTVKPEGCHLLKSLHSNCRFAHCSTSSVLVEEGKNFTGGCGATTLSMKGMLELNWESNPTMISMVLTMKGGNYFFFSTNGHELYIQNYDNNATSPGAFPLICTCSVTFLFLTLDPQIIVEAEAVWQFPAHESGHGCGDIVLDDTREL